MDILLTRITGGVINYAVRSGITITAGYAFKQCNRLLNETSKTSADSALYNELLLLQTRLRSKLSIISPAIDMIELIASRGNTSLESAVALTKEIRTEIDQLGSRLESVANEGEEARKGSKGKGKSKETAERELQTVIRMFKTLLIRIEDAVPLINLAITTSGVNLNTRLSGTISPSRLVQASTFLTAADSGFVEMQGRERVQVGPTWVCSLYMLFAASYDAKGQGRKREVVWKEAVHKCRLKLVRVPLDDLYELPGGDRDTRVALNGDSQAAAQEFAYQLLLVEDLDDDRVHTFEDDDPLQPGQFDDVATAGIRDVVPVHEISKLFYADTGKILGIGDDDDGGASGRSPVLLVRRDVHARAPESKQRGMRLLHGQDRNEAPIAINGHDDEIEAQWERESAPSTPQRPHMDPDGIPRQQDTSAWRLPPDLDPEWMALEVYTEEDDPESDADETLPSRPSTSQTSRQGSVGPDLSSALSHLTLRSSPASTNGHVLPASTHPSTVPPIKTSLSLLEMLLKLSSLQQHRQASHLTVDDQTLNFFLEDSATANASDRDARRGERKEVSGRVGFDPYEESPIKRRTEEYVASKGGVSPHRHAAYADTHSSPSHARDATPLHSSRPSSARPSPLPSSPGTPSPRGSTPPGDSTSESHRREVLARYAGASAGPLSPPTGSLQTPPSSSASNRTRQALLRSQTEPKGRSPLGKRVEGISEEDE